MVLKVEYPGVKIELVKVLAEARPPTIFFTCAGVGGIVAFDHAYPTSLPNTVLH